MSKATTTTYDYYTQDWKHSSWKGDFRDHTWIISWISSTDFIFHRQSTLLEGSSVRTARSTAQVLANHQRGACSPMPRYSIGLHKELLHFCGIKPVYVQGEYFDYFVCTFRCYTQTANSHNCCWSISETCERKQGYLTCVYLVH